MCDRTTCQTNKMSAPKISYRALVERERAAIAAKAAAAAAATEDYYDDDDDLYEFARECALDRWMRQVY